MASLYTATDGEITEFKARLARAGLTAEMLREVNRHDDMAPIMLNALKGHPRFTLIHGVFNPAQIVHAAFMARCLEKGIDCGRFVWVGSEAPPKFDPDDPETVVVLDATLGTLQETFEFAWKWAAERQEDQWRWDGLRSDQKHLRLLSDNRSDDAEGDSPEFKPWTLKWVRIKLDANVGKRPIDVRNVKTSPGCALLWMAAEHPERIKATDYERRFGFWLPGLKCMAPDRVPWSHVPCVYFYRDARQVGLRAYWCGYSHSHLAVPVLRE